MEVKGSSGITGKKSELPRYRITEKCYIKDRVLDPESMPLESKETDEETGDVIEQRKPLIITFEGVPGYFMEPINEAAKAQVEKYKNKSGVTSEMNPISSLSMVV